MVGPFILARFVCLFVCLAESRHAALQPLEMRLDHVADGCLILLVHLLFTTYFVND